MGTRQPSLAAQDAEAVEAAELARGRKDRMITSIMGAWAPEFRQCASLDKSGSLLKAAVALARKWRHECAVHAKRETALIQQLREEHPTLADEALEGGLGDYLRQNPANFDELRRILQLDIPDETVAEDRNRTISPPRVEEQEESQEVAQLVSLAARAAAESANQISAMSPVSQVSASQGETLGEAGPSNRGIRQKGATSIAQGSQSEQVTPSAERMMRRAGKRPANCDPSAERIDPKRRLVYFEDEDVPNEERNESHLQSNENHESDTSNQSILTTHGDSVTVGFKEVPRNETERGSLHFKEVECRDLIFEYPKFDSGFFVLRCVEDIPMSWRNNPLANNGGLNHYRSFCDYHGEPMDTSLTKIDLMEKFGLRVDGATRSLVEDSNRRREEMIQKNGGRKGAGLRPVEELL